MESPIVIGGVGGSGTRVVAQIVTALGYVLGTDMDARWDDRWFNLLFYRPRWFARGRPDVTVGLDLQRQHALGERRLSPRQILFLARAVRDVVHDATLNPQPLRWSARRLGNYFRARRAPVRGWGWKEPITHLLIDEVLSYFPAARYIHVVRNGLDMAFSGNQYQLQRFGALFGVTETSPQASLHYWVIANQRALSAMRSYPSRALVVNFDRLCLDPMSEVSRIVAFIGASADVEALAKLPVPPKSIGRHKSMSLAGFDTSDIAAIDAIMPA